MQSILYCACALSRWICLLDSETLSHGRFGTETKNSGFISVCLMKQLIFLGGFIGVVENVEKNSHFSEQTKTKDLQVLGYGCTVHTCTCLHLYLQAHLHLHLPYKYTFTLHDRWLVKTLASKLFKFHYCLRCKKLMLLSLTGVGI
jgi:hypothetical protein